MFLSLLVFMLYILGFLFGIICLACGLYYFAELVEEHASIAKRIIRYTIISIMSMLILFGIFENVDFICILLSLISHGSYFTLLSEFPFVTLTSVKFIISIITMIVSHCWWFMFFRSNWFPFSEIISVFVFFVWLVPFIFFVSLSANDSALPFSSGNRIIGVDNEYSRKKNTTSSLKAMIGWVKNKTDDLTGRNTNKHYY
ncbi:transmembrane protein [Heterostelium album PN500]|uniref:Transmembrane protein n=1 Tax=Heterostelium pallidum (strain ATCC 26659 / Pp 5 / PN500) TaxID=670386 RepID=D3BPJ5_HETP5|nr:transmembrane protein [Heterostelium album PN500]EFA76713.1 transmembrane protein [Heterostelium album PN500]|eukprot:XP_020428845.1 transmembrane protein [Heterostelium album PN500]